uniref:4a-hydroxytetrahydrobiopterin dehydratase n=1 Tax=Lotharella globosa TaxID=91324 RepID=A0A7S3YRF9_9EUKA|mmetsp:Transcript_15098/g.30549  ORF Transcript_15098/g.30549 Transcript_15098/m.30549 type:complete len:106 (+) Transcript_15098:388-705(+)
MQRVSSQRCRELYEEEKVPKIRRRYRVKNFVEGVKFFNDICEIAESENHHPDLHLEGYQHVTVCIYTHSVRGLTENDFILAAKIDGLQPKLSKYHKSKQAQQTTK